MHGLAIRTLTKSHRFPRVSNLYSNIYKPVVMREELQARLYADFPQLFRRASLPMTETCMCWGVCVGDGWEPIIRKLCKHITSSLAEPSQTEVDLNSAATESPAFEQIKEKFGELRVYMCGSSSAIDEAIDEAEKKASETCERCGKAGRLWANKRSWLFTACQECADAREDRRKDGPYKVVE